MSLLPGRRARHLPAAPHPAPNSTAFIDGSAFDATGEETVAEFRDLLRAIAAAGEN